MGSEKQSANLLQKRLQSKNGHHTKKRRQSQTSESIQSREQEQQTIVEQQSPSEGLKEDVNASFTVQLTREEYKKIEFLRIQVSNLLKQVQDLQTEKQDLQIELQNHKDTKPAETPSTITTPFANMSSVSKMQLERDAAAKENGVLRQKMDEIHTLSDLQDTTSYSSSKTGTSGDATKESKQLRKDMEQLQKRLEEAETALIAKGTTVVPDVRNECLTGEASKGFAEVIDDAMAWVFDFVWTDDIADDATPISDRARDPAYEASVRAFRDLCDQYPEYRIHSRFQEKEETALQGLLIRMVHSRIFDSALGGVNTVTEDKIKAVLTSLEENSQPKMTEYECRMWYANALHGIKMHPKYVKAAEDRVAAVAKEVLLPLTVFIDPTRLEDASRTLQQTVIAPALDLQGRMSCTAPTGMNTEYMEFIKGEEDEGKPGYVRQWDTTDPSFFDHATGLQLRNVDNKAVDLSKAMVETIKAKLVKHCVLAPGLTIWTPQGYKGAPTPSTGATLVKARVEVSWGTVDARRASSFLDELYGMAKP